MNGAQSGRFARYASLVTFGLSLVAAVVVSAASTLVDAVRAELVLATGIAAVLISAARGLYRTRMVPDVTSMSQRLAASAVLGAAFVLLGSEFAGQEGIDPAEFLWMTAAAFASAFIGMFAGSQTLKRLWRKGQIRSRAVVVGTGRLTNELLLELRHRRTYGVDIVGIAHVGLPDETAASVHADVPHVALDDLPELVRNTAADRVIIGPSSADEKQLVSAARWAANEGIPVFVVPRLFEMGVGLDSLSPDRIRGYPLIRVQRSAHPRVALLMKRGLDVAVSGTALALLSPLMVLCAVAVKLSSRGPIFFSQDRIGKDGRPIVIAKFRSMTMSETSDVEWTAEQRVTRVGSVLRRTSLDELPQLFSILRGDMSLVGPRPERPAFVREFAALYADYDARHRMHVGLTGLAQVVGLVGDTSIEERIKYDNLYIDQWSFGGDLQILVKTAWAVLRQPAKKREQKELESALSTLPPTPSTARAEQAG